MKLDRAKISSKILGKTATPGQVLTDPVELLLFERDAGIDSGLPDAVAFPESVDQVVEAVRWASANQVPIVARGAGTGLTGGAVAEGGGLVLEFSRLNRLLTLDEEARLVTFQPGLVNAALNSALEAQGWYYPPDPGSGRSATMGGTIAENAGGPHCLKYGVTGNYITGLKIVTSDGRIVQLGGAAIDYPEFDFTGLLTGSEGTLGIIIEATARIIRPPEGAKTMMAGFRSVEECGQSVSTIIAAGILPATIEMMDQKIVRIVENYANSGLPVNAEAVLIVEVDGYLSALDAQMEEIAHILKQHGAFEIRTASTEEERARIWKARKSVGGAISRLAPSYYPADATVPRTELATALSGINRICREADLEVGYALHAGDGNLHPHILIPDPSDPSLLRRVMNAAAKVMKFCVALGGSITGEHGVGIEKRQFMTLMYGPSELQAMQDVKEVFDPVNLLNPGKILPRFTYTPSTPPLQSESGGFGPDIFAPSSPEEVVEAFLAWRQGDKPTVRIIGGQTKSSLMPDAQVRLSSKALTGITRFAPDDLYVTVKAGTKLVELEEAIQERGGMFVPLRSPWPDSTIGGIVSTNFNAPLRCLYGGIRDLMLAVKVVLPDGRVIRVGRPFVKDVAGYDMAKLFTGAYGVLGFLCEISLRLVPAPHYLTSLVVPAPDLHSGLKWGKTIRRLSRLGSALLLCRNGFPGVAPSPCFLVHTLEGRREEVRFEASALKAALSSEGAPAVMEVGNDAGSRQWASFLASPGTGTITLRLGVPVRGLARMLELVEQAGTQIEFLVDLASGLIYAHVPASQATIRRELAETARMEGGYCLAINGPEGSLSRDGIWGYEPESLDLMRRLKMRWDPGNLVNPRTLI